MVAGVNRSSSHVEKPRSRAISVTHLGLDQAVLWTCHENKTLDLEKVGQLRRIQLANADGITFLVCARDQSAKMGDQG